MRINDLVQIPQIAKTDLHMHTRYCDGRDEPEEMVLSAIRKGFSCIGFSGHSYVSFDPYCEMGGERAAAYRDAVCGLKEKYRDQIRVFCGVEQDYCSDEGTGAYDYVIGSVHYFLDPAYLENGAGNQPAALMKLEGNGTGSAAAATHAALDDNPQLFAAAVKRFFGGDYYLAAEQYFAMAADVVRKTGADIIGHFDLISKFNEKEHFFDESHPRYVAAWRDAADRLIRTGKIFEINTGAISRGLRSVPYPNPVMIRYIREHGGRFVLSSDSHTRENIGFDFDKYNICID